MKIKNLKNILQHLHKIEPFQDLELSNVTEIHSRGLAHDHVKLGDTGWILRIPRGNQLGMTDEAYLKLQNTIFQRAAASKRTPDILGTIVPNDDLPHGALIVQYIKGRNIQSEQDLNAVAECLGQIHKLPVPVFTNPLEKSNSPLSGQLFLLDEVFKGAFDHDSLSHETKKLLKEEYQHLKTKLRQLNGQNLPFSLIGGDSHLGNYLIGENGKAYMVDLEFASYDLSLIDLADACLSITSELDPDIGVVPSPEKITAFYQTWKNTVGSEMANALKPAIKTTEQLVQLRTLAWLCYWQAEGQHKEKSKVSPGSFKNWNRMAKHYLDPKNLAPLLGAQQKRSTSLNNNNKKTSAKSAFKR